MLLTSLLVAMPIQAENWVSVASYEDDGVVTAMLVDTDSIRSEEGRTTFIITKVVDGEFRVSEELQALDCVNRMVYYLSCRFDNGEFQQQPDW